MKMGGAHIITVYWLQVMLAVKGGVVCGEHRAASGARVVFREPWFDAVDVKMVGARQLRGSIAAVKRVTADAAVRRRVFHADSGQCLYKRCGGGRRPKPVGVPGHQLVHQVLDGVVWRVVPKCPGSCTRCTRCT